VALCGTVWHCAALCGTVRHCVALCDTVWHCATLCGTVWGTRNVYRILVLITHERTAGRPTHIWKDTIKIRWEGLKWTDVAEDRCSH
jgi:hypothetical protein